MPLAAPVLSHGAQDLPQVQADEIEALQSILGPDFAPGQPDGQAAAAWGNASINQPLFTLTIRPDEDRYKDQVFVKVEIRLPKRYPNIPLICTVPTAPRDGVMANVSSQQLSQLASVLKQRATELAAKGEEAIWEVYSCGAELLSDANLIKAQEQEAERRTEARRKSEMIPSLEEEKQRREGEGQKLKAQELDRKLEAERKTSDAKASSLAKVMAEKEEAIRAEKERRRVGFESDVTPDRAAKTQRSGPRDSKDDSSLFFTPPGNSLQDAPVPDMALTGPAFLDFDPPLSLTEAVTIARFQVSPIVRDDLDDLCAHHYAIPISSSQMPPQSLDTINITSSYFSTSRGRRKLAGLERELEALSKIDHRGLRQMRGFQLRRTDDSRVAPQAHSEGHFTLYIVSAPPSRPEARLDTLLSLQPLPVGRVFDLAEGLLTAADELHVRGLLLKDVSLDRICMLSDQSFLIDAVWKGSVLELARGNPFHETLESTIERWKGDWVVPELQNEVRFSRKSDTFAIGRILLLSLVGIAALSSTPDPWAVLRNAETSGAIDEVFAKFLGKLLDRSARKRPTPAEAVKYLHSILYLRAEDGKVYLAPSNPDSIRYPASSDLQLEAAASANPPTPALTRSSFFSTRPANTAAQGGPGSSRFLSDFVTLSILGKGAFGIVTKVRNRLDGGVYAVKKIKLDGGMGEAGDGEEKTLREIGALARVNHPHVTRYYAAWIEEATAPSSQLEENVSETTATESGAATTSVSSSAATDTGAAAPMSFSLSFGPPKDGDFDDIARAEEEDFLSHVGFEEEDASSGQSSESDTGEESVSAEGLSQRGRVTGRVANRSKSRSALDGVRSQKGKQAPRWLYIQMELVDDVTLRELIEKGPIGLEDCWRLLRQILNALVHIHNLGIVHRDLKPSNILMAGQDVKIGDFGLATTLETIPTSADGVTMGSSGLLPPIRSDQHQHQLDSSGRFLHEGSDDMTGEVGTALYTAPEIVRKQGARYGYKVDMYSLGIILFEMFASGRIYSTGMERVQRLRGLRQSVPEFPPAWPSELVKERQVVQWLVTHKAEDRPSPLELLQSDLLPPRLEDESVQETLRLVTDHSSVYHLQLLDALFAPQPLADEEIRDVTFDAGSQHQLRSKGGSTCPPVVDPRESVIVDFLRTVFLRHGAVDLQSPLLMPPRAGLYSSIKDGPSGTTPVQLLDATGQVVFLPRDHLIPFARLIARSENHRLKRFCIGPVYRDSLLAGGQPLSILAANMDIIVGSGGNLPSAAEGECLACLEEILGEVPGFKSDWVILINHGAILDLLLERVPAKQHSTLLSTLSALSGRQAGSTTASIRQKLSQEMNLPRSLADELEACALMAEDIETAQTRLERILPVDHRPALTKAVQAILDVRDAARKLGVSVERRFLLCPLLSNYSHCYRGSVFFQVARAPGSSGRKRRRARWDVVASGGRYSSLIAQFATPLSGPPPSGVGLQLAVSKLISALARDQEINELRRPPDLWTPRRADVYVHSSPGMLDLRMAICKDLWSHGIRADLSYEDDVGQESSMLTTAARCKEEGFSFLIFGTTRGLMKVRSLWSKMAEGEFISMFELVPWLIDQLARASGNPGPGGMSSMTGAPFDGTGVQGSDTQGAAANVASAMTGGFQTTTGLGSASADLPASSNATNLAPAMMETQIVLPVHASSSRRPDKSDKSNHSHMDRRVKLASNHPIINSATNQVHKIASSFASGEVPVIAVDLRGEVFDALCVAAMGKNSTRRDIGWRAFLDTLGSGEEKEYVKSIRGHIEKCGDGLIILWSIREKRAAVVGSTGSGT